MECWVDQTFYFELLSRIQHFHARSGKKVDGFWYHHPKATPKPLLEVSHLEQRQWALS